MKLAKKGLHNSSARFIKMDVFFVVALASAIYFLDFFMLSAVAAAAAAHELGHILCLRLLGLRINAFHAEVRGFCIDYSGVTGVFGHMSATLAGPVAGLGYAYVLSCLAGRINSSWCSLSSGISLLLSLFNLLPILPLDGGRIFLYIASAILGEIGGARLTRAVSFALCLALFAAGIWLALDGKGAGLAIAAVWLMFSAYDSHTLKRSYSL